MWSIFNMFIIIGRFNLFNTISHIFPICTIFYLIFFLHGHFLGYVRKWRREICKKKLSLTFEYCNFLKVGLLWRCFPEPFSRLWAVNLTKRIFRSPVGESVLKKWIPIDLLNKRACYMNKCNTIRFQETRRKKLTHFMAQVSFYTPRKHLKISSFLLFSGGIEGDQWHEIG